jgi:cobalt-zinc-cadmium efflux system outer membrane protein
VGWTVAVAALAAAPMAAQQPTLTTGPTRALALAEVEQMALDSNPGLRAYRLEVPAAVADVRTASLRPNPTLALTADIIRADRGSLDPRVGVWGGSIQLPLEFGGKRGARMRLAEQVVSVTQLEVADSARRLLLSARQAWFDLVGAREQRRIADEVRQNWQQLVTLNESRFRAQQISGVELQRAQVALSTAQIALDQADLAVRSAQDALAAILGMRERVDAAGELAPVDTTIPSLDSLEQTALRDRPDVLAARAARIAADADVRLQHASGIITPTLSVDALESQNVALAGLSAQVPLPLFSRNQGGREKAAVRVTQADRLVDAAEVAARTDVRAAWQELATRRATLDRFAPGAPDGILARARAIRETAAYAYRRGGTSLLDLLDAERTAADLTRAWVDAVTQFNRGRALVDAAAAADAARLVADELPGAAR